MRIVAGTARGRKLFTPRDLQIRPTSDRVRQSLYDVLGPMDSLRVLDLFAGSGALGLEALSRGADQALFIDRSRAAEELIRRNVDLLGFGDRCDVWRMDASRALGRAADEGKLFDLVLLDPPYKSEEIERILGKSDLERVLRPGARVILEGSPDQKPVLPDKGWTIKDSRRYGGTLLLFLEMDLQRKG